MRKLKLQVQLSIDGFAADKEGSLSWMTWDWDEALKKYVSLLTDTVDTMLVGRISYEGMAAYWPAAALNNENEEQAFACKMNEMKKIVFSRTLEEVKWNNSTLSSGSIEDVVKKEKENNGKDMIIYGGASIVSCFIAQNLIDEYHLFINPVVLGEGKPVFQKVLSNFKLELVFSRSFPCGITVLNYQRINN